MADRSQPDDPTGAALLESALLDFWEVMQRLRAECPWKQEQTHRSLTRYLLEETHETLEAIDIGADTDDWAPLRDELGDLLLQVWFHAAIAEEAGEFTLAAVAQGATAKMIRRNPHVFGPDAGAAESSQPLDAAAVDAAWQAIKQADHPRSSPVDGLPGTLPALLYAVKAVERGLEPVHRAASDTETDVGLGERLLALVAEAVADGVDPEQALRDAVRRRAVPAPGT